MVLKVGYAMNHLGDGEHVPLLVEHCCKVIQAEGRWVLRERFLRLLSILVGSDEELEVGIEDSGVVDAAVGGGDRRLILIHTKADGTVSERVEVDKLPAKVHSIGFVEVEQALGQ